LFFHFTPLHSDFFLTSRNVLYIRSISSISPPNIAPQEKTVKKKRTPLISGR
jgi:hypothetical protein